MLTHMHVYRFHDKAAVSPIEGPTHYMTAAAAELIAAAFLDVARSIRTESFTASTCGTKRISPTAASDGPPLFAGITPAQVAILRRLCETSSDVQGRLSAGGDLRIKSPEGDEAVTDHDNALTDAYAVLAALEATEGPADALAQQPYLAPETLISMLDGDTLTEEWRGPFGDWLANNDLSTEEELARITSELAITGESKVGGGADPLWFLEVIEAEPI